MPDIRHIAAPLVRDDVVAIGEFETTAYLYHLTLGHADAPVQTVLSFGGDRLALCEPGGELVIVAAAWERHGVCGYSGNNGERLWQRKDLKRAGPLSPAGDGSLVAAAINGGALQVLNASTGDSVASVRKADRFRQSAFGAIAATGWYQQVALVDTRDWASRWKAALKGYAVLDATFAPDGLLVSDTGDIGHVYAFQLDGRPAWTHRLPKEMLCWAVGWDENANEWLGLAHNVNQRTPDSMLRWSRDGRLTANHPVPTVAAAAFVHRGRTLVTDRELVNTQTGTTTPLKVT
jgi:hypothetical protein